MSEGGTVVVAGHWRDRTELSFVTRAIAGAASRLGPVSVLVPGAAGRRQPDGAFDLEGMGEGGELCWPDGDADAVVVDHLTPEVAALLTRSNPGAVFYLSAETRADPTWRPIHLVGALGGHAADVSVPVPVNPLAEQHRHHGFGFTGYQLVLSGRSGAGDEPPPAVAWLSAAFHDADVVVVEDAVASAWRGRALRGRVAVDTRMDLWRLLAHANVCIDLAPGRYVARECVEALRFGTPIIVPEDSGSGVMHALAGGGRDLQRPRRTHRRCGEHAERREPVSRLGRRPPLRRCPLW